MKKKEYGILISILLMIIGYLVSSVLSAIILLVTPVLSMVDQIGIEYVAIVYSLIMSIILLLYDILLYKSGRMGNTMIKLNIAYVILLFVILTTTLLITGGAISNPIMIINVVLGFPFIPVIILMMLFSGSYSAILAIGIVLFISLIIFILFSKKYKLFSLSIICIVCICTCVFTYLDSPQHKYKNQSHNFTYMNGFSSIDLTEYTPYSKSGKLAELDHEPELLIENKEDMPIMDGAEACYPVYSAIAKAIYKDIDIIESEHYRMYGDVNGKIVSFYNTAIGFERLISGDVDMFFGAKPSNSQLALAEASGVELEYTPIGKEAFVFFVNENNSIDELTSDQIRAIYHGDITNWKEVGGKNKKIVAFQRPERSGSQSMMVYFMGDISLKEPVTYEMISAMSGIIEYVAEYHNESGAIGYSFRYFLEGLHQQEDVKMLKVDGVYPDTQAISSNEYPIITPLYCITVKGNDNQNVAKVLDFILSEDGQYLVEQMGYSPVQ